MANKVFVIRDHETGDERGVHVVVGDVEVTAEDLAAIYGARAGTLRAEERAGRELVRAIEGETATTTNAGMGGGSAGTAAEPKRRYEGPA